MHAQAFGEAIIVFCEYWQGQYRVSTLGQAIIDAVSRLICVSWRQWEEYNKEQYELYKEQVLHFTTCTDIGEFDLTTN